MIVNKREYIKQLEEGDKITCGGMTYTIKSVISCCYWGDKNKKHPDWDWGFYCEFIAVEDNLYHYWKQQIDGGYAEAKK